jgi:perosamine synthetase
VTFPRQILYIKNIFYFFNFFYKKNYFKALKKFQLIIYKNLGIQNLLPVSMGRFGLYLACKECLYKNKNEIILSPFTIFDVANMVICSNGKPVFCDINKTSTHLSLKDLKRKINKKTSAIILTHYETINPELKEIYKFCKKKNIKLINDLAIAIDSKLDKKNLCHYSDFSIYSFGFYKFLSCLYGGGLYIKNKKIYNKTLKTILKFPSYTFTDLIFQIMKFWLINFCLNKIIFNFLTFPIFHFAYANQINFLLRFTKNDPNPFLRKKINAKYFKKLNINQIKNIIKNIENLKKLNKTRKANYLTYKRNLDRLGITLNYDDLKQKDSSFINFPIVVKDKAELTKFLMNKGFDLSQYFYRDCSKIKFFQKYGKKNKNVEKLVNNLIILPTHHLIDKKYAVSLSRQIIKFYEKS